MSLAHPGANPSPGLPQPISRAGHPSLSGAGQGSVSLESQLLHPGMEVTARAALENTQLWVLPPQKKRFQPHLEQPRSPQGFVALLEPPNSPAAPLPVLHLPISTPHRV